MNHYLFLYLFYTTPFLGAYLVQSVFCRGNEYFRNKWFWFIVLFAPALFVVRITCHYTLIPSLVLILPVIAIWWVKDSTLQPIYGVTKIKRLKPYLLMLGAMVPIIAFASRMPDFMKMYPRFKGSHINPLLFELCYGFDFVSIEFFFRGFLILSLVKICGVKSIFPAACFYCAIHSTKPLAEMVGSFFGGLILGMVVYRTKSIWGGLVVHLGIAWMMEIAAYYNY